MNIIRRNLPVFIIGFITLAIFAVIIIAAQNAQPQDGPSLNEINTDELIAGHTYVQGPEDAPVTLVEFSDYQCPACKAFHPIIQNVFNNNSGTLRWAYRHYPLPQHPYARKAAEAAQIAGEQGKFWEYSALMFKNQENLTEEDLIKYAEQVGLDVAKFTDSLKNGSYATIINDDIAAANKLKINATPTFFLNGKMMKFEDLENFNNQINKEIEKFKSQSKLLPNTTPNNETLTPELNESIKSLNGNLNYAEIDKTFGALEIAYTNNGFDPKNTTAREGQLARFTNKTDSTIIFYQPIYRFEDVEQEVTIQPGANIEIRLSKTKIWSYREKNTDSFGSIFVNPTQD
ncbi:MAG: DSBA-like protein thioredoxin domain-containing protein [candidate division WWE3 bacterium GW2011_GWC1_41_7]|uniref:DSBA-like protein thioredoxin domain-containing protein n=4 Tax=Katanobacteria TaxID=422282 RepID=A0A0G0X4J7_UNCKA|nr:MAG: DSBA-like protein thioredoxin domain-containing protein [candidate division WWE3 bacterium GW2011_GWB1_41_6]KKS19297.1 MAG: DSBA-like protein thioredoxin domain-containing protein [candidate division WWE3 bacterium GW2011_GWC1_41_7]KKS21670.1 MAG: DSBA-like protein thioredoxin domain-containing protein [candidate division WWE3 bacterium GW2011_GWA1_41_8]OGC57888.1 MAG: hypothetical protein A2976_03380 [candidate division WWE3 bacterium RIFCSPLOWO2_01_FULL_41_9]